MDVSSGKQCNHGKDELFLSFIEFNQLVFSAVESSARELAAKTDDDGNDWLDIAFIHVAHSRIQARLRTFAKLVQAQPTIVPKLTKRSIDKESEVVSSHKGDYGHRPLWCKFQGHPS